ncbi:MAG TPA: hypothetical protein VNJ05_10140 [Sphingomicrobium sp.]|nr:hypothetical protein [Sphingomicrobium sp.]
MMADHGPHFLSRAAIFEIEPFKESPLLRGTLPFLSPLLDLERQQDAQGDDENFNCDRNPVPGAQRIVQAS